ncbi:MAG TPA: choice-of-anchor V domain-containing protein [Blastocatellia bacterium]|nr:choice-of-anchor V domain-containing protein [Blastocatellia bacterium]
MLGLSTRKKLQTVALLLTITGIVYAKITGPDPGYTNAPNDIGNCVACHDTFHTENVGSGSVTVSGEPINGVYQPGQVYTLTVTVAQSQPRRQAFGFQLTALDSANHRAGTLASLNGDTQVNAETGFGGRQYIEHTELGTFPNAANSRVWQVRWTAPDTDIGTVSFYIAGNAANGDRTNQQDYIYTNKFFADSPTSHVTLALATSLSGQALEPGAPMRIDWTTTGASNIDNIEVRYSTDDGATFPITNQIFFTTDGSVTGFDWTVPNIHATSARLRITVGTKSGSSVTPVISAPFTINGTGGPPQPVIQGVMVQGKKLLTSGQNFADGASLFMCDTCAQPANDGSRVKKTFNDETTPATLLVSNKGGKQIAPGQTVNLQVQNPDGSLSNTFTFTRPQ